MNIDKFTITSYDQIIGFDRTTGSLEMILDELNDFKGGMAENYVNTQLLINGYTSYYWQSERGAEVDFVIQRNGQIIPIGVKSADKPAYAIKLSAKNFGFEDGKKTVPLYAAFCI